MKYYVRKSGNNANTGLSPSSAVATINAGICKLKPGDTLLIGEGIYVERVEIRGLKPEDDDADGPITTIKSLANGYVRIENTLPFFRTKTSIDPVSEEWELCTDAGAHRDEYVSAILDITNAEEDGMKGAFLDFEGDKLYTRLINYSNINDLRSDNETFGKIKDPPLGTPGIVQVTNSDGTIKKDDDYPDGYYFPFVYMGPGFWLERGIEGNPDKARIHIRLSNTNNNIEGLDYTGETNPNKINLAFTVKDNQPSLQIGNSRFIRFERLTISFGGSHTVKINSTKGITFEKVNINASEFGVLGSENEDLVINNCTINGGMPPWYFRGDKKSGYHYKSGDEVIKNNLGKKTISSLIKGSPEDIGTIISNCDLINGHDIYLVGKIEFHHNYINNLNDDGIFFMEGHNNIAKVYKNVFTKCLSCFSFAQDIEPSGGPWYIYNNLVDLREPTESFRPNHELATPQDDERYGWLYKNNGKVGRQYFFHNTAIVVNGKAPDASFSHLLKTGNKRYGRINFNNIFVAVSIDHHIRKPVMIFSSPVYPDASDGNLYYRIGSLHQHIFQYPSYTVIVDGIEVIRPERWFDHFDADYKVSYLYKDSQKHYHPGYENSGKQISPQFRSISDDGRLPMLTDDFRLAKHSPARKAGVVLSEELAIMAYGRLPTIKPNMGCFHSNSAPLRVGVGSRHSFPQT